MKSLKQHINDNVPTKAKNHKSPKSTEAWFFSKRWKDFVVRITSSEKTKVKNGKIHMKSRTFEVMTFRYRHLVVVVVFFGKLEEPHLNERL